MGTDRLGRDVLSRVMVGSRDVLIVAPLAALLGVAAGTLLGLVMGYYRGAVDDVLSRLVEAFLALPVILVGLLTLVVLGTSPLVVIFVVGILFTPIVARTVRSAVLSERELDYVTAAKLRGESGFFILSREIFPNVLGPTVVEMTVRFGYAIFTVATLSFLGVGLQPPSPDWGLSVSQEYTNMISGRLVADAFPGARDRQHGRRGQPDRRLAPVGPERMTIERSPRPRRPPTTPVAALKVEDLVARRTSCAASRGRCCAASRSRCGPGESYGLVGESGCGKSTTAYAAVRYLPRNGVITGGRILVDGEDITKMSDERAAPVPDPPRLDGLPGSRRRPQPDRPRSGPRSPRRSPSSARAASRRRRARCRRCSGSRSPIPKRSPSATRTSFQAGCSSASSSPSRWLRTRSSSSSTSRRPGSTRRSRRACSTSSDRSRPRRMRRSCSSPTTSASSGRCATGSA